MVHAGMDASLAALWSLCTPSPREGGLLLGMFMAGLVGSAVHCAPMCGGFVLGQVADRMSAVTATQLCEWRRLRAGLLLPYHAGRLVTYAALGALGAGSAAVLARASWFSHLSAALLMVAAVMFLSHALLRGGAVRAPLGLGGFAASIRALTRHLDSRLWRGGFLLGLALGLLPCAFLYGGLVAAASTSDPLQGALAMLAFGLGTVPGLLVVGVAGQAIGHRWKRVVRVAAPGVMAVNAVMLFALAVLRL